MAALGESLKILITFKIIGHAQDARSDLQAMGASKKEEPFLKHGLMRFSYSRKRERFALPVAC